MVRSSLTIVALLALCACTGETENPVSDPADPLVDLQESPPPVVTGWPCPPFDDVTTTEDKVGDTDGDAITDCQEEVLQSDPSNPDSDGDGVGDYFELGALEQPLDTDGDGTLDMSDTDDDDDGVPT